MLVGEKTTVAVAIKPNSTYSKVEPAGPTAYMISMHYLRRSVEHGWVAVTKCSACIAAPSSLLAKAPGQGQAIIMRNAALDFSTCLAAHYCQDIWQGHRGRGCLTAAPWHAEAVRAAQAWALRLPEAGNPGRGCGCAAPDPGRGPAAAAGPVCSRAPVQPGSKGHRAAHAGG